jgi:hypothetical protein
MPNGAVPTGAGWILNTTQDVPQQNKTTTPNGPATRASTATACLTGLAPGQRPRGQDITGWQDAQLFRTRNAAILPNPATLARCHLIAQQFGGRLANNLVPCWQWGANAAPRIGATQYGMKLVEARVATYLGGLETGQAILYQVEPRYRSPGSTIPFAFFMSATLVNADGTRMLLFNTSVTNTLPGNTFNLGN